MDKLDILCDHLFNEHKTHFMPVSLEPLDEQGSEMSCSN